MPGVRTSWFNQEPPLSETDATAFCLAFRDELKGKPQVSDQQALDACKGRMSDSACRKCLGLH
jgi:hypothetical protein